jgi:hypothetical protein
VFIWDLLFVFVCSLGFVFWSLFGICYLEFGAFRRFGAFRKFGAFYLQLKIIQSGY